MNQEIQQIYDLIQSLDIHSEAKGFILKQLEENNLTEELFDIIDQLIAQEQTKNEAEIEALNTEIKEKEEELKNERIANYEEKQSLHTQLRNDLKAIFQDAVRQFKGFAQQADDQQESQQHSSELGEIDDIRQKLGL